MNRTMQRVGEMISAPFSWISISGIRSTFRLVGGNFWPKSHPKDEGTIINYDYTRTLYRNSGENGLGAGFAKPIVDLQVSFMGIPRVSTDNDDLDTFLNECISTYWVDEIQQMLRDSIRDSKVIVRIQRPDILDPLMTLAESLHCRLEVIAPERVDIERNFRNRNIIERVRILHRMVIVTDPGDVTQGREPITEEHDVLEIIDRQSYRFFDQNTNQWLDDLRTPNPYRFVPILEVDHEWDTALQGGQSDLETVIPFINAFHDVITQGLQAHKYHSTPKVKLKLQDVLPFIKNNFPEAWDETTGSVKSNAEVSWRGREIIFLQSEDEMEFLEARSVLGDTKTLAEFLIDCICIASATPEWAFMRVDSGSANSDRNAQTVPFVKKIEKKRNNFAKPIQELCKMALVMRGEIPLRPAVSWDTVRPDDEMILNQAFQQLVMGLEAAKASGEISDSTYQRMIKMFLPHMKQPQQELQDAKKNVQPQLALPAIAGGPQGNNE